jgi:hypothetical protein
MHGRQLPARWALESVGQILRQLPVDAQGHSEDGEESSHLGSTSDYLDRLTEIKFRIAEIFAQLTGDDI